MNAIAHQVEQMLRAKPPKKPRSVLPRRDEVVALIMEGKLTFREIAQRIGEVDERQVAHLAQRLREDGYAVPSRMQGTPPHIEAEIERLLREGNHSQAGIVREIRKKFQYETTDSTVRRVKASMARRAQDLKSGSTVH